MTFEQLELLNTIVRAGSFSKAAVNAFISQPTLTRIVAAMEKELGFALFERLPGGIRLTPAGNCFFENTRPLLSKYKLIKKRSADIAFNYPSIVRLGICKNNIPLIANLIQEFRIKHPNIKFEYVSCRLFKMQEALINASIDICLLAEQPIPNQTGFLFDELFHFYNCALMSRTHSLAQKEELYLDDMKGYKLLLLPPKSSDNIDLIHEKCRALGIDSIHEYESIDQADIELLMENAIVFTVGYSSATTTQIHRPILDLPKISMGLLMRQKDLQRLSSVRNTLLNYFKNQDIPPVINH